MLRSILVFFCLAFAFNSFAETTVVRSALRSESRYVKIISDGDKVSFKFCDSRSKRCENIGPRNVYSKKRIGKRVKVEYARMAAVGALDFGLAMVAGVAGGAAFLTVGTSIQSISVMVSGGVFAMGIPATLVAAVAGTTKTLNPVTYYRNAKVAKKISRGSSQNEMDILGFKESLEDVLYKVY